jgi:hypothetical protein
MKKGKFIESQGINILKAAEAGKSMEYLSRHHGFSKSAFYNWNVFTLSTTSPFIAVPPPDAQIVSLRSPLDPRWCVQV